MEQVMIDRKSYEPLYVQVRKDIEDKILEGHIKIGDKLMSEAEMIRNYIITHFFALVKW